MNKRIIVFITLCLIWGSTWLFIKIGLEYLPPISFAAIRFGLAAIILWGIAWWRQSPVPTTWQDWQPVIWASLTGVSINYSLIFWGEKHISSGLAAVLQSMLPAFGLLLAHYFLPSEKITWRKALGVMTGILGVTLIFSDQLRLEGRMALFGSIALVTSALFVALSNVIIKARSTHFDPLVVSAGQMTIGVAPLFLIGFWWEGNPLHFNWTKSAILALTYLFSIGAVLPFALYYWLIRHMDVTKTMLISLVTPIVAVGLGMITLNERLTWRIALGGGLILLGVGSIVGQRLLAKYQRMPLASQASG